MSTTDEETLSAAIDIANGIEAVVRGKETAAVFVAIGKVLGAATADAERPDLCGLMVLISQVAQNELARRLSGSDGPLPPSQTQIHNAIAPLIVSSIVKPPLDAGGSMTDVLIVLESVILGVMLMAVKLGGDEVVLDTIADRVKQRLAEQRLGGLAPAGRA